MAPDCASGKRHLPELKGSAGSRRVAASHVHEKASTPAKCNWDSRGPCIKATGPRFGLAICYWLINIISAIVWIFYLFHMRASRSARRPGRDVNYANETAEPEPTKNKKREVEIRDLTPTSDVKGGATKANKDEKHASRRTGEVDFMKGRRPYAWED